MSTNPALCSTPSVDIQLSNIETGISSLLTLANEPVAQEALDVTHSVDVASALELLRRLRHSLRQYIERGQDLCYVALIGHFSAGKSSTVNSVLSLWNTQNERRVDLNPTDTAITLITKSDNEKSLLGVVREGIVPIRTRTVESDVLEHLVIADTPGTGDPQEIQEIARQFLPLCDTVLFLFSAASPFDITDIPLLTELRRRLPFIPIKFVITRADEFRIDRYAAITDDNLQREKLASFLSDVISRLNKSAQLSLTLEPADFFVIDNVERYHIQDLQQFLLHQADSGAVNTRIQMHGHKVQFFRDAAYECHAILQQRLNTQFEDIDKIVATARRNVERFQECITPANATITKRWLEELQRITLSRTSEAADVPHLQAVPRRLADLPMSYQSTIRFSQLAQADAASRSSRLAQQATTSSTNQLNILVASIQENAATLKIRQVEEFLMQLEKCPRVKIDLEEAEFLPASLDAWIEEAAHGCISALKTAQQVTTDSCNRLERKIAVGTVLKSVQDAIGVAGEVLSLELDKYFEIVLIYHGSVFARHVKEAIARAGLGKQLDDLEHEMSEEQRLTTKTRARQSLIGALEVKLSEAQRALPTVIASATRLRAKASDAGFAISDGQIEHSLRPTDSEALKNKVTQHISERVAAAIEGCRKDLVTEVGHEFIEAKRNFEREAADLKAMRLKRFGTIMGSFTLAGLLVFVVYHFLRQPSGQKLGETILIGVASSVLANVVGFGWAKATDNFPKRLNTLAEEHSSLLRARIDRICDSKQHTFTPAAINQQQVVSDVLSVMNSRLSAVLADLDQSLTSVAVDSINSLRSEYEQIRSDFNRLMDGVVQTATQTLGQPESASKNLESIAAQIRDEEISPSFSVLDETRSRYQSVHDRLMEIKFN